jgi:hypothetical protein
MDFASVFYLSNIVVTAYRMSMLKSARRALLPTRILNWALGAAKLEQVAAMPLPGISLMETALAMGWVLFSLTALMDASRVAFQAPLPLM